MPQLTKAVIDRSLHKESVYMLWDDTIKGFGCKIHPSKKTFVYCFRSPQNKKLAYITIGVYGSITVDEARIQAKKFAHSVQIEKIDPREIKKAKQVEVQQSITFEEFWQVFTEKYIKKHHQPSTINRDASRIKLYILPFFGKKPIADIERRDVLAFKDSLSNGTSTKCLRLLSVAFNQAELWEYRSQNSNPCQGVTKQPEKKMNRFLSDEELDRLNKVLVERSGTGTDSGSNYTIAAFRLLIYTGCRLGEVLSLKWEDVNLKENFIHLKESKGGERGIPLNESAKNLIAGLQKKPDNPYVFCGKKPGTHLVAVQKIWGRIRKKADIPDFRIHDFRHSFASFALKKGVSLYGVSKLLGHKNIATTTRYAHLELEELKKLTNIVDQAFSNCD